MSAPASPTNLLARNVGNGSVELQWDSVVDAAYYNVYLSTSFGGTYRKANRAPILSTTTRLPNIKFGLTVYFKATAVNAAGEESAQSDAALDATCVAGVVTLQFEGLVGDQVPLGAVYTARVGPALVSFRTTSSGVCA